MGRREGQRNRSGSSAATVEEGDGEKVREQGQKRRSKE